MIRVFMPLVVMLIGAVVIAQPAPPDSITFKSKRYQVTTDLDRREAQAIARHMDTAFDEYTRRLSGFPVRNAMSVRLYLFQTQQGYLDFLATQGINAANTAGIFWSRYDGGLASWVEGQDSARMFHVLQHEGFHQFARIRIGGDIPPWVNEGMAEYFGVGLLLRGRFTLGLKPSGKLRRVQDAIRDGSHIPLRDLLTMPHEDWNARVSGGHPDAGLQYDQSWAVVHFLVHANRGRYAPALEAFLKLVSQGRTAEQAFGQAFQTNDFGVIESLWKEFILAEEPDPVSTAVERLQFLAAGAGIAHAGGMPCGTIEELKASLREFGFEWFVISHGAVQTVSAEDDALFEAPAPERRGKTSAIELSPSDDGTLPPEIAVTGLKAKVRVTWSLDAEGLPVSDVVIN